VNRYELAGELCRGVHTKRLERVGGVLDLGKAEGNPLDDMSREDQQPWLDSADHRDELFANALEKTTESVRMFDGKIYRAFDDIGTGLNASLMANWFYGALGNRFGDETGGVFGMCLTMAMVAVAADRRTGREVTTPEGEWQQDAEWTHRMTRLWAENHKDKPPVGWVKAPLQALVGYEPADDDDPPRWHMSVAHEDRIPTWDELVDAAHALRPGVPFCVGLPPKSWWLNYDERVLHLWEIRDEPLVEGWRKVGLQREDTPT
jgi:hypothetical protein